MLSFKNNIKRCQYQADSVMRKNKVNVPLYASKSKQNKVKQRKSGKLF